MCYRDRVVCETVSVCYRDRVVCECVLEGPIHHSDSVGECISATGVKRPAGGSRAGSLCTYELQRCRTSLACRSSSLALLLRISCRCCVRVLHRPRAAWHSLPRSHCRTWSFLSWSNQAHVSQATNTLRRTAQTSQLAPDRNWLKQLFKIIQNTNWMAVRFENSGAIFLHHYVLSQS